jgi:hypothetical protein
MIIFRFKNEVNTFPKNDRLKEYFKEIKKELKSPVVAMKNFPKHLPKSKDHNIWMIWF